MSEFLRRMLSSAGGSGTLALASANVKITPENVITEKEKVIDAFHQLFPGFPEMLLVPRYAFESTVPKLVEGGVTEESVSGKKKVVSESSTTTSTGDTQGNEGLHLNLVQQLKREEYQQDEDHGLGMGFQRAQLRVPGAPQGSR